MPAYSELYQQLEGQQGLELPVPVWHQPREAGLCLLEFYYKKPCTPSLRYHLPHRRRSEHMSPAVKGRTDYVECGLPAWPEQDHGRG